MKTAFVLFVRVDTFYSIFRIILHALDNIYLDNKAASASLE